MLGNVRLENDNPLDERYPLLFGGGFFFGELPQLVPELEDSFRKGLNFLLEGLEDLRGLDLRGLDLRGLDQVLLQPTVEGSTADLKPSGGFGFRKRPLGNLCEKLFFETRHLDSPLGGFRFYRSRIPSYHRRIGAGHSGDSRRALTCAIFA